MKIDPHSKEYPTHVIDTHTRGIICAGEVWIQFCDFATSTALEDWLGSLTPELDRYFRQKASNADFALCRCEKECSALRLVIDWYETRR